MLDIARMEAKITLEMSAGQVPGLALAIVQGQQVIYAQGFGVTSVEDGGLPVTPQTLFRVGSVTKPLTGTMLMRLVESGKPELDCPISEYLPWLTLCEERPEAGARERPPRRTGAQPTGARLAEPGEAKRSGPQATRRITLRMLLSHTSGLPTDAEHFGPRDPGGLERFVREETPGYPLLAPPGTFWAYSNVGLNIAGYLAEAISGLPYMELMQQLLFDPLAMRRTTFDPLVAMTYPLALAHERNCYGELTVQHQFAENTGHHPGGFALSTALDLANFAMLHLNQGCFREQRLLLPASVAAMHRKQVSLIDDSEEGYGLTFYTDTYRGQPRVSHGGAISTYGSHLMLLPQAGIGIALLTNRADGIHLATLANQIIDGLIGKP
jgi:CubicO group peptidase (beta-lactamase class C family)